MSEVGIGRMLIQVGKITREKRMSGAVPSIPSYLDGYRHASPGTS